MPFIALLFLFIAPNAGAVLSDPFARAAEYYFLRYDYRQAYDLWSGVYKRQPQNFRAVQRVAELQLMFEGRSAARDTLLKYLKEAPRSLTYDERRQAREKLAQLHSGFLTNEGQSLFFQALPRVKRRDCASAGPLLSQAAALEQGNLRVLREKARCEKILESYDPYYETLKSAYSHQPFDTHILNNLAEAHLYFGKGELTVALLPSDSDLPRTSRQKTALGIAQFEAGHLTAAQTTLQQLVEQEKVAGTHPMVHYVLGRIYARRADSLSVATQYLERFLSSLQRPENTLVDGWDPYRSKEKLESAQSLLAKLKKL